MRGIMEVYTPVIFTYIEAVRFTIGEVHRCIRGKPIVVWQAIAD